MTTKRTELPFVNPIGDSLEMMKKMWGFAGLPGLPGAGNLASMAGSIPQQLSGMFVPTLDVAELEKRIADLRAVEKWLELNAGILRATIQSLEVQCATIATLKGISGALVPPMFNRSHDLPKPPPEVALGLAAMRAEESKAALQQATPIEQSTSEGSAHAVKKPAAGGKRASETSVAAVDPAAWWNTLQDQFARIASAAAGQSVSPTAAKPRKATTKRRAAKRRG